MNNEPTPGSVLLKEFSLAGGAAWQGGRRAHYRGCLFIHAHMGWAKPLHRQASFLSLNLLSALPSFQRQLLPEAPVEDQVGSQTARLSQEPGMEEPEREMGDLSYASLPAHASLATRLVWDPGLPAMAT